MERNISNLINRYRQRKKIASEEKKIIECVIGCKMTALRSKGKGFFFQFR
jgi:hypothetical protein